MFRYRIKGGMIKISLQKFGISFFQLLFFEQRFLIYYQKFEHQILTKATKHLYAGKRVSEF